MRINPSYPLKKTDLSLPSPVVLICAVLCWLFAFASLFTSASPAEEQHRKGSEQQGKGSYGAGQNYKGLGGGGRSGYGFWGGRHIPIPPEPPDPTEDPEPPDSEDNPDIPTTPASSTPSATTGSGSGNYDYTQLVAQGWCSGPGADAATVEERFSEKNMQRLMRSVQILSPGIASPLTLEANSPIYKVAAYQLELEHENPDLLRAGTLLGSLARTELTVETIREINTYLCLILPEEQETELRNIAVDIMKKGATQP